MRETQNFKGCFETAKKEKPLPNRRPSYATITAPAERKYNLQYLRRVDKRGIDGVPRFDCSTVGFDHSQYLGLVQERILDWSL